jgi:hypothetical protein
VDEHRDKYPNLKSKTYKQIYQDVRRSVDLCHRDGVIKDMVGLDPGKYIQSEPVCMRFGVRVTGYALGFRV